VNIDGLLNLISILGYIFEAQIGWFQYVESM